MKRSPGGTLAVFWLAALLACAPPTGSDRDGQAGDGGADGDADSDGDGDGDGDTDSDPPLPEAVRVRGRVWSPGADLATTLESNRFPIPGAAVIAYSTRPVDLPQGRYCNECVDVPEGTPNVMSDPVDGTFEILLTAGRTYYLTVQKGEFRRVREYGVPDRPGEVVEIGEEGSGPRPELTTLPARTDLAIGDNIPKFAMVRGAYENMAPMFNALGFDYDHAGDDFDIYCQWDPFGICPGPAPAALLNDPAVLDQYNVILVSCGEDWPARGTEAADNLRRWVHDGGSLYVDDFNYDFVERPWPELLSWYVDSPGDEGGSTGPCATDGSASSGVGDCNNWSEYDFAGDPSDVPEFAAWLALPEVNRGDPLTLYAAWDYIYELGEGVVGVDDETGDEVRSRPRVWMYNGDRTPFGGPRVPATVSWPYYCGRALYTVYHTHSSGGGAEYELLLQEKIMMYLIMEVQTCSTDPVVY